MQISGANLLLASQQAHKPAPQAGAQAAFTAALNPEKAGETEFSPLGFRKVSAPEPAAPAATEAQASSHGGQTLPPGRTLDIRI